MAFNLVEISKQLSPARTCNNQPPVEFLRTLAQGHTNTHADKARGQFRGPEDGWIHRGHARGYKQAHTHTDKKRERERERYVDRTCRTNIRTLVGARGHKLLLIACKGKQILHFYPKICGNLSAACILIRAMSLTGHIDAFKGYPFEANISGYAGKRILKVHILLWQGEICMYLVAFAFLRNVSIKSFWPKFLII